MDCRLAIRREGPEDKCKLPRFMKLRKCLLKLVISGTVTMPPSPQYKNQRISDHMMACCPPLTQQNGLHCKRLCHKSFTNFTNTLIWMPSWFHGYIFRHVSLLPFLIYIAASGLFYSAKLLTFGHFNDLLQEFSILIPLVVSSNPRVNLWDSSFHLQVQLSLLFFSSARPSHFPLFFPSV